MEKGMHRGARMGRRRRKRSDTETYLVGDSQASLHTGGWIELLWRYKGYYHTKEPRLCWGMLSS